ncbi:MAG: YciI family protein [Roseinatronobacter sp.]
MYFLMICHHHDGPEIAALRDSLRPAHRDWVASGGGGLAVVLTGAALWDEDGAGIGNFGVLEAESEANARAFADGDPFATGGVVREIALTRLADTFRAERIDPLTRL